MIYTEKDRAQHIPCGTFVVRLSDELFNSFFNLALSSRPILLDHTKLSEGKSVWSHSSDGVALFSSVHKLGSYLENCGLFLIFSKNTTNNFYFYLQRVEIFSYLSDDGYKKTGYAITGKVLGGYVLHDGDSNYITQTIGVIGQSSWLLNCLQESYNAYKNASIVHFIDEVEG